MRGLTLRITNPTTTRANLTDIAGGSSVGPGETIEVLYTNDVQQSLEFGSLNTYLTGGGLTATFVSGSSLSRAPIGSTLVGATPTADGVRGLVPRPVIADRDRYLKGDGTWYGVTALTLGAVPEAKFTTPGDTLFRGTTTSERLPLGTLGQVQRSGSVRPEWSDAAKSGVLSDRPLPGPTLAGVLYWATDQPSGSRLSVCYFNGTGYGWLTFGAGGSGGNTNTFVANFNYTSVSPLTVGSVTAGQYIERAVVITNTAWDGIAPQVQFGTSTSPSLLLQPQDVDLTSLGQYESGGIHKFLTGDTLTLTITPSGSTLGTGTLLFTLVS